MTKICVISYQPTITGPSSERAQVPGHLGVAYRFGGSLSSVIKKILGPPSGFFTGPFTFRAHGILSLNIPWNRVWKYFLVQVAQLKPYEAFD